MKTAILYTSKSGATEACAMYISSQLKDSQLFDLSSDSLDINDYDILFIGSGIRMGKFYKPFIKFINTNLDILKQKKCILFVSNHYPETLEKSKKKSFSNNNLNNFEIISCGGVPPFNKITNTDWINKERIDETIKKLTI
jgi:menaquinone-dependent protoporphyrinogen oxidase